MKEVTAETNLNGKKTRTPKDAASITKGALNLPLDQRVKLRNELTLSIDNELHDMEERWNAAKTLVNPK